MTRLTDLLEEVRGMHDLIGQRQVNVVVDGEVKHSGKYESFCWNCAANAAGWPADIKHKPECIMSRIDAAIAAATREKL